MRESLRSGETCSPLTLSSAFINVPFLNFMSLLAERSGEVIIRVGGNTQDYATLVANTSDGRVIEKTGIDPNNPVSARSIAAHTRLTETYRRPLRRL